jgi:hypothetical protein
MARAADPALQGERKGRGTQTLTGASLAAANKIYLNARWDDGKFELMKTARCAMAVQHCYAFMSGLRIIFVNA